VSGKRGFSPYSLRKGQHEVALHEGETLIGRSSECSLILDGALVSRRHAIVRVQEGRVFVRDLESRNGTAVNGQQIQEQAELQPDDQLLVGNVELQLLKRDRPARRPSHEMRRAPTMTVEPVCGETDPAPPDDSVADDPDEKTRSGNSFELLGGVIEKFFALGKVADATRLLDAPIDRIWQDAKRGGNVPSELADQAAAYAVRLAEATGEGTWVTKAVDIFAAQQRLLPLPVIDQLYAVLRRLPEDSKREVGRYVKDLQDRRDSLSAAERFALKRLEGLIASL
jgi:hypothetical protein